MFKRIFRPKPGQVPQRFSAFRLNGTANFRGDTVFIDSTAPTSQGASGVVDGLSMTAAQDFIFVKSASIANGATIAQFAVAGVIEGRSVGDRNTTVALDDDGIVIVQVAGVHTQAWMSATTGIADWIALADSASTLGASRPIVGVGVTTDAAIFGAFLTGIILATNATTGTRGTVTNTSFVPIWVRCGDVI